MFTQELAFFAPAPPPPLLYVPSPQKNAPKTPPLASTTWGWAPNDLTQLQFVYMYLQVTPEERSLAAAMRWQDELTSRGCHLGPGGGTTPTPLMSLANYDPGQLALLQRSESRLLSAAAAAQARASVPTSSLPITQHAAALDTAEMSSQCEQAHTTYHDRHGTPLKLIKTDNMPSMQAEESSQAPSNYLQTSSQQTSGSAKAAAPDSMQRQSAPEMPLLARLPSAKGHCLMRYPNARPQSPIRHPSTRRDLLNGTHASNMLSVRPFGAQSPRPSTAAPILDAAGSRNSEPADTCEAGEDFDNPQPLTCGDEGRPPAVLLRCSQPSAVAQTSTGSQPESQLPSGPGLAQTSQSAADDIGTPWALCESSSGCWEQRILPV